MLGISPHLNNLAAGPRRLVAGQHSRAARRELVSLLEQP
jgi:hypothetical protein